MEAALLKYALPSIFLLVQALLILLNLQKTKKQNGQYRYNPHPPGDAPTCVRHGDILQKHGEALARLEESTGGLKDRLDRIEGKLNGK